MKNSLFITVLLIICAIGYSQDIKLHWANTTGDTDYDGASATTTDAIGNVYVIGYFYGTVDLDPGTAVQNHTSNGSSDLYIQKFDPAGNLLWAKSTGGHGTEFSYNIATDASANVYFSGIFRDTANFDFGTTSQTHISNGQYDMFLVKLDANGNFLWANSFGGIQGDNATYLDVDPTGNVLLTGIFQDTVDFDPGPSSFILSSNGERDVFIAKFLPNGGFGWAKSFGGLLADFGTVVRFESSGKIFLAGTFSGTADLATGTTVSNFTSNGSDDVFIQQLDASGNSLWIKTFGGSSQERVYGLSLSSAGNVYLSGGFQDTVDFDPGSSDFKVGSMGSFDAYITKLDNAGNFLWTKTFGGTDWDITTATFLDASENVIAVGIFQGTADMDPDTSTSQLISKGGFDTYVQKTDSNGMLLWAISLADTSDAYSNSVAVSPLGNILIAGEYNGTLDCDPDTTTYNLVTAGNSDAFVVNLIEQYIGIPEPNKINDISAFPNPSKGRVNLNLDQFHPAKISIVNTSGQLIFQDDNVDIADYSFYLKAKPGIYFVQIHSAYQMKVIKLLIH